MAREIALNIALYPSAAVSKRAIKASQTLKNQGALFVFDGKTNYPHVTLYYAKFPYKNFKPALEAVSKIAEATKPFAMKSIKQAQHPEGWVNIQYKKSPALMKMHRKVVRELNSLRGGLQRAHNIRRLKYVSAQARKNINIYGSVLVNELFVPHITFTKLRKRSGNVLDLLPDYDYSFKATEVAVFRPALHGACDEVFARFRLGK